MTEHESGSDNATSRDEEAAERAARRAERKKQWLEERVAREAVSKQKPEMNPVGKLVDLALTPSYIAVGTAVIVYRLIRGFPPVTEDDYEDEE